MRWPSGGATSALFLHFSSAANRRPIAPARVTLNGKALLSSELVLHAAKHAYCLICKTYHQARRFTYPDPARKNASASKAIDSALLSTLQLLAPTLCLGTDWLATPRRELDVERQPLAFPRRARERVERTGYRPRPLGVLELIQQPPW